MQMNVTMGGKIYGSYEYEDFDASIEYDPDVVEPPEYSSIEFHPGSQMARGVATILLGKKCPRGIRGRDKAFIVHPGERIARLHLEAIMEDFDRIDFSRTPWKRQIAAFRLKSARKRFMTTLRANKVCIVVHFRLGGRKDRQTGGEFAVSPAVAAWLGKQLLRASSGDLGFEAVKTGVRKDAPVR